MYLDNKMQTMKYAELDFSHHPIVIVRVNSIEPSDQQFEEYLQELTKVVKEIKNGVLIFQLSNGKFLASEKRIKIGNWIKEHAEIMKQNMYGVCYVNTSFIAMTILKGIFLVNKPPIPSVVLASESEGIAWAKERIAGGSH
jgi:hypothetical protein